MGDEANNTETAGAEGAASNGDNSNAGANGAGKGGAGTKGDNRILGKFKDQAALEAGYAEVERLAHTRGTEAATLKRELDELRSSLLGAEQVTEEEAPATPRDRKQILEEFATDPEGFLDNRLKRAIEAGVSKQIGQTQEQLRVMAARIAIKEAAGRHGDFGKYQQAMVQISQETGIRDPERLYQMAKFPDAEASIEQLQSQHKAEMDRLRKQAFAEGGGIPQPRMTKEDQALAQAIVNAGVRKPNPFI